MIDAQNALDIILDTTIDLGTEQVKLMDAVGRVIGEDVYADRPFPPFDRVCMDGIAIDSQAYLKGISTYEVEGIGTAGAPQMTLKNPVNCIEIMTGAPLPNGTDTVVRYEDTIRNGNAISITTQIKPKANIHYCGQDISKGQKVIPKGHLLKAIDINVLASVGIDTPLVYAQPKVAVVSTGKELVPISSKPLPHQIRRSNVQMLLSKLTQLRIPNKGYHVGDDKELIKKTISEILESHDVLMFSGGVSKGKFDFVPDALEELGIQKIFHRVAQRPGKPFWFGKIENKIVFAFPGNPVSTLACFTRYFLPWWHQNTHRPPLQKMYVKLKEDVHFKPDLTYFAQANIHYLSDGTLTAMVDHGHGSGDMISPTTKDGFVVLPRGKNIYKEGESYEFLKF